MGTIFDCCSAFFDGTSINVDGDKNKSGVDIDIDIDADVNATGSISEDSINTDENFDDGCNNGANSFADADD